MEKSTWQLEEENKRLRQQIKDNKIKIEQQKAKNSKKVIVAFILTMPNIASWNGQWTGSGKLYARTKKISRDKFNYIKGNHYYRWDDGWGANVEVKEILPHEKNQYDKKTSGFCGYEWMINSIIKVGKILNSNELKEYESSLT